MTEGNHDMKGTGIYIVQLLNREPMPVTRDQRYVDICAKANKANVKVGKAKDFVTRRLDTVLFQHDLCVGWN